MVGNLQVNADLSDLYQWFLLSTSIYACSLQAPFMVNIFFFFKVRPIPVYSWMRYLNDPFLQFMALKQFCLIQQFLASLLFAVCFGRL